MGFLKRRSTSKRRKSMRNPLQVIALGFTVVILCGTFILMLPIATRSGIGTDFITALFTATSATCVTGLVVADTFTFWSTFGQNIILLMIQIGGMGFMLVLTAFSILVGRRITIRERLLISKSMSVDNMSGIVKLAKRVIATTLAIEAFGALILSVRFAKDFGFWGGIRKGIFHSVSAFCNAGIDIMGDVAPYGSLSSYSGDFVVTVTISCLIIVGGLGFYLWNDIMTSRAGRATFLHTKIVLLTTGLLLVAGTAFFLVAEWNNPATMGGENAFTKLLLSFFQSSTSRTAGFNQIDQALMTPGSKVFTMVLMFIGGSPGSTAGGVKTVTVAVLMLATIATLRGRSHISIFGRTLSPRFVMDSIAIVVVGIVSVVFGTFMLTLTDAVTFEAALFECISAFGTVGLSEGITASLGNASRLVLIALMYIGRVGIITLGLGILVRGKHESKIKYPDGKVIVG